MRSLLALLWACSAVAAGGGCAATGGADRAAPADAASGPQAAHVLRVVDGDTIIARVAGRRERIRYIGIDTPESVKPNTPVQCFAIAASRRNKSLIGGRQVTLRFDVERRDRYGRLLAYVYRDSDGLFVNADLVRGGYAVPMTIPPNVRHANEFVRLAREARRAGRGLWSACR